MTSVRVHVLGALRVTVPGDSRPKLPRAACQLIGLIAAAGRDGIARDEMAAQLWGEPLPESWMSALRNRLTASRKILGASAIVTSGGRLTFADHVSVDSWDLIGHVLGQFDLRQNEMAFLQGETLLDIDACALASSHAQHVVDARAALMQEAGSTGQVMSPRALQSMRTYLRRHPSAAIVAVETISAHVRAGENAQAITLIEEIQAHASETPGAPTPWVARLDRLLDTAAPRRRHDDKPVADNAETDNPARAELFDAAVFEENWSLALEVALEGLPAASRVNGDPERLALLRRIPLDKLDPSRKFNYCLAMALQLMASGNDHEALQWSQTVSLMATSPNQLLLAHITAALVGESDDERTPIEIPAAFEDAPTESVNMRSLQVAVISHLERASFEAVAPLRRRFTTLVEASGEPYRRWHLLLLESMTQFVDGEVEAASTAAWQAFKYAELFDIADAQVALISQLSNARWVHHGFPGIDDYFSEFPGSSDLQMGQALQAVAAASNDNGAAVHDFLKGYNYNSRSFFTFPTVTLLAPHITEAALRSAIADRLRVRTGTSAIWGTGVLHLGPVDRTLAMLTNDRSNRDVHLSAAVDVADQQRLRLWQVVCRLDLASATASNELRDQASELATTPALRELVDNYASRF